MVNEATPLVPSLAVPQEDNLDPEQRTSHCCCENRRRMVVWVCWIVSAALLIFLVAPCVCPRTIQPPTKMMAAARLSRRSLIVDTDLAFDDMVALLSLQQSAVKLELITTVGGVNSPRFATRCLECMFPSTTIVSGQPLGRDRNESLPRWLTEQRANLKLFAKEELKVLPDTTKGSSEGTSSMDAVVRILSKKQDVSVDLLCIGPLTNVASWLQSPKTGLLISTKIKRIYIMGGNDPSLIDQAEFNFSQDPKAAEHVFKSIYTRNKLVLVPQEICTNTVDSSAINDVETFADAHRSKLLARTIFWDDDSLVFDPLTAFCYTNPDSCRMQDVHVKVDDSTGIIVFADSSSPSIRMVTHVDALGYVTWLKRAIVG